MSTAPQRRRDHQQGQESYPVLVVDDHELFSMSLVMVLSWHGLKAEHVRPVTMDAILARANELPTGLVVLDLSLGKDAEGQLLKGGDLVGALRHRGWTVIIVSGLCDERQIAAAIAAGAIGFVPKSASFDTLFRIILLAINGMAVMPEGEHRMWLELHRRYLSRKDELTLRLDRLTNRERVILEKLAQGHRAATIADKLVVSLATVRSQIQSILSKLRVNSQLEAVALFQEYRTSM